MIKQLLILMAFTVLSSCKSTSETTSDEKGFLMFRDRPCQASLKATDGTEINIRFTVRWLHGYRAYPMELQVIPPNGALPRNIEVKIHSQSRAEDHDAAQMAENRTLNPKYDAESHKYLAEIENGLVLLYDNRGIQSTLVQTVEAKVDGNSLIDPIGHKNEFKMTLFDTAKAQHCLL